ncbi:MAG: UTP--glucose-1-phosphate uridylyltransferase [Chitinophagales bacterium]
MDILDDTIAGVGGEIQLTDALDRLFLQDQLSAFLTDASKFDCGNKEGFMGANITVGMRDENTKRYIDKLMVKNGL